MNSVNHVAADDAKIEEIQILSAAEIKEVSGGIGSKRMNTVSTSNTGSAQLGSGLPTPSGKGFGAFGR